MKLTSDPEEFFSKRGGDPKHYFRRKRRRLRGEEDQILLGEDPLGLEDIYLDLKVLKTHLHIIGATGTGKTKFMELLIRQLMFGGQGLCVIDPHGGLYEGVVNFVARFPRLAERVVFFDPTREQSLWPGFNPLARVDYLPDLAVQVKYVVRAVAKVWEEESKRTPLLRRMMRNILYPLIEGGYTFLEAEYFTELSNPIPRTRLVQLTTRDRVRREWKDFEALSYPRKKDEIGSLQNRLPEFTDNNAVRMILGRTGNVLDMEDIFENRKLLICNLSQRRHRLSADDARMLGTLLINEMVNYALSRDKRAADSRPFFLFIDEFQNFITPDVGKILDECRKFGLHLVMAHQHLDQLKKQDPSLFGSVMTNARTKIIFGGLGVEDAELLARNVFAGELDLKEIKDEIHRTTVVGYEKRKVSSNTWGESSGSSEGSTSGSSVGYAPDEGILFGPEEVGSTESEAESKGRSKSISFSDSESEAFVPVLGRELASRERYNLEEQRYRKMVELKKQPTRHAIVKVLESPTQRVRIRTVGSFPEDEEAVERARQISYQSQGQYYLPAEEVARSIEERQRPLLEETEAKEPETFQQAAEDEDLVLEKVKKVRKKR